MCVTTRAAAADVASSPRVVAAKACAAIGARVDANAGSAPVLLRSYDAADGRSAPAEPSQATAAYLYDNALAVIALDACGNGTQAKRVGEALRRAATQDSRLRNAYRAGSIGERVEANGWWDARGGYWAQDPYQQGTSTGNVAWTGLALMGLHDATHAAQWLDAARSLGAWLIAHAADDKGDGLRGGIDGDDAHAQPIAWKSAEHNIDAAALFARLAEIDADTRWRTAAAGARRLLDSFWDDGSGHFFVGTRPDGTLNRDTSALDVQLWAQLLAAPRPAWRRAVAYVDREHGLPGGFDFNADRDGVWLEGTAQAALVYRSLGRERDAQALLATIAANVSPGGYIYATREGRITTGLAIGASGTAADFYYYRLPHLGATAWAALAALGCDPFTGKNCAGGAGRRGEPAAH